MSIPNNYRRPGSGTGGTSTTVTQEPEEPATYEYDSQGRLIKKTTPTKTTSMSYNGLGQLVTVSDGIVTKSFVYDNDGKLIEKQL